MTSVNLQCARYYASRGWPVFPIYPMRNGECGCGDTGKHAKGKHPITFNGRNDASTDLAKIDAWWAKDPDANIGIATGRESSLLIVDLDDKEGRQGSKNFYALAQEHGGDVGKPMIAISGSGGRHLYYSSMDANGNHVNVRSVQSQPCDDVDIRAEGGYIIVAPSNHELGGSYGWEDGALALRPTPAPAWLHKLLESGVRRNITHADRPADVGLHVLTFADVEEFAKNTKDEKAEVAVLLGAGESLAPNGKRHMVVRDFCASLWMYVRRTHNAWVDTSQVWKVFKESCGEMAKTAKGTQPDEYWIRNHFDSFASKGEGVYQEEQETKVVHAEFMQQVNAVLATAQAEKPELPRFDADPIDPNPVIDAVVGLLAARPEMFVNNENKLAHVVRVKGDAMPIVIEEAALEWLRPILCSVASWTKPLKDNVHKPVQASKDFTRMVMERRYYPDVQEIKGVAMSPFFREDGTLCATEGYDRASGAWLALQGLDLPAIPEHPTKTDAVLALAKLKSLVSDFSFEEPGQVSVWLSIILTALSRPLRSPLHLINAANPGTGKGLLSACAMAVVFGQRRVVSNWTASEEENEKRLVALAIQGSPVVWLDNVAPNCHLGGAALEGGISEGSVGRELGSSKSAPALNNVTFLANGNNVRLSRDMGRRTLRAELVATCANPSARPVSMFAHANLLEHVQENQGEYLAAALTVLRAYYAAGSPTVQTVAISFSDWSRTVASALVWAGEEDPARFCVMLAEKGAVDEATEALVTICEIIRTEQLKSKRGSVKPGALLMLPPMEDSYERLMEAFEVMGLRKDVDAAKVGRMLKSREKSIVRLSDGAEVRLERVRNPDSKNWEYLVSKI